MLALDELRELTIRLAALLLLTLSALLAVACDDGDGAAAPTVAVTPSALATAATPAATVDGSMATPPSDPTASPAAPTPRPFDPTGQLPAVRVERVFPQLSFERLTGMYEVPDGSGRFVVTLQEGRVLAFENRPDVASAATYLDLRSRVNDAGFEQGLLGLAFAPDFPTSGHVYVDYTASGPNRSVVSRFTVADPPGGTPDPASELVILAVEQPRSNHNGGQIAFGPDGYLYIGLGDGGGAGDPDGNGQDPTTLLGSLLRIDVAGGEDGRNYRIPPDNPLVATGAGARPEIWAWGLRNPWRFSFDGGYLWLGDVGQARTEEIDLVTRGYNYGWNLYEGSSCYTPDCQRPGGGLRLPVVEYGHEGGNCSVTGGFVYRGSEIAGLYGAYVYGDFCSGKIWALRWVGGGTSRVTEQALIAETDLAIVSFATDLEGNLYVLSQRDGGIYKLVP